MYIYIGINGFKCVNWFFFSKYLKVICSVVAKNQINWCKKFLHTFVYLHYVNIIAIHSQLKLLDYSSSMKSNSQSVIITKIINQVSDINLYLSLYTKPLITFFRLNHTYHIYFFQFWVSILTSWLLYVFQFYSKTGVVYKEFCKDKWLITI